MYFASTCIFILYGIVNCLILKRRNFNWYRFWMESSDELFWIYRCYEFDFKPGISWYFSYPNSSSCHFKFFFCLRRNFWGDASNYSHFKLIFFREAISIVKFHIQDKDTFFRFFSWPDLETKLFWIKSDEFWKGKFCRFRELDCS